MDNLQRFEFDFGVDQEYVNALGRIHYNFAYLQWVAIYILLKLGGRDFRKERIVSKALRDELYEATEMAHSTISDDLHKRLIDFNKSFRGAVQSREKLIRTHPYTEISDNSQRLQNENSTKWSLHSLNFVADGFREIALEGNDLFHGQLAIERPQQLD